MTSWRWRLALAWHRHQLRHWRWAVEVAMCRNDPQAVGDGLRRYDLETRLIHRLEAGGP